MERLQSTEAKLRTEKEQLRTEKEQLRTKEEQLRSQLKTPPTKKIKLSGMYFYLHSITFLRHISNI